jgi:GNAT superfamily N-acetyltransferase
VAAEVAIRLARSDEQAALEDLQRRASLANEGDRAALLAHPDAIELPMEQIVGGRVWVAESEGRPAGFAVILPRTDGDTELDGLFVDPGTRRHGIGRALVDHCAEVARREGSGAMHVIGNYHAEAFYAACGFDQIGTTGTRFGPALLLRRTLR